MTDHLAATIADARSELRRTVRSSGLVRADYALELVDAIALAAEDFTTWLGENDARLWSGLKADTLRKRFPAWHEMGHARLNEKRQREYRRAILPRRTNLEAARQAARRAVEGGEAA